jgi:hypothetical protein
MSHVFTRNKLPFMLAILYSVPLLMISILCASLALDKPQVAIWHTNVNYPGVTVIKKAAEQGMYIATQYTSTSNATEWRIWGWAIVPPLILLGLGIVASFVRYGGYLVTLAAIAITIGVSHRLDTWVEHHTARYPFGYDNIPDNTNKPGLQSNYDTGQWERSARHTVISIRQWLIVGACAALLLMVLSEVRRRRGRQWQDTQPPAQGAEVRTGLGPPGAIVPPAGGVPPQ